jgi:hypothetical protein
MNNWQKLGVCALVVTVIVAGWFGGFAVAKMLNPLGDYEAVPREGRLYLYDNANQSSANYLVDAQYPSFHSGDWYEVGIYIYPMNTNVSTEIITCTLELEENGHSQVVRRAFVVTHQGQSERTYTAMGWLSFSPEDTKRFSYPEITLLLQCEGYEKTVFLAGVETCD